MDITVVIPTLYNPKTLKLALKSVYNQTHQSKEIIIIDSSATKKSQQVVSELISEFDDRIIYKNLIGNPNETRNHASELANNELVAFLDDDDTWEKNYLQTSIEEIKNHNLDFIFTNMNIINENDNIINFVELPNQINIENLFVYNNGFFCSNLIIKKKVFLSLKGFDSLSGSADKDLAIRLVEKKFNYKINTSKIVNKRAIYNQWSQNHLSMIKNNFLFFSRYKNQVSIDLKIMFFKKIIKLFLKYIKSKLIQT